MHTLTKLNTLCACPLALTLDEGEDGGASLAIITRLPIPRLRTPLAFEVGAFTRQHRSEAVLERHYTSIATLFVAAGLVPFQHPAGYF